MAADDGIKDKLMKFLLAAAAAFFCVSAAAYAADYTVTVDAATVADVLPTAREREAAMAVSVGKTAPQNDVAMIQGIIDRTLDGYRADTAQADLAAAVAAARAGDKTTVARLIDKVAASLNKVAK